MLLLKKSESTAARRRIPVVLVDETDGRTPETGITFSAGDIKLSKNGGSEANHAGSVTELAGGHYFYEATQSELDTVGYLMVRLSKSGVRTVHAAAQVVDFDPYAAAGLGLTNLDAAISSRPAASDYTAARAAKIDNLDAAVTTRAPAATAISNADYTTARAARLDHLDVDVSSRGTGDATAASQSTILANQSTIDAHVLSRSAPGDAMALTSAERNAAADALLDRANGVETGETPRQALRLVRAACVGKSDGFPAGPVHFRDRADAKNRITATVDADGNRSAVSTDAT